MKTRKVVGIVLATNGAMIVALLLALWAASSAAAVPEPGAQAAALQALPTPVPGGPGYYSVGSGEMQPTDHTIGYQAAGGWISTSMKSTLRPVTLYVAGLHLPQGARVTKVVVYGYDDDPSEDFWYRAVGQSLDGDAVIKPVTDVTYSITDTGAFVGQVAANEGENVVDNSVYNYVLVAHLPLAGPGKQLKILGFRVDYTFGTYVPLVMKEH